MYFRSGLNESREFSRQEVAKLILDYPNMRLVIWNALSLKNQYAIWSDKIDHVMSKQIPPEWRFMLDQLHAHFSFEMYDKASREGLASVEYLSNWSDQFDMMATEEERYAVIGSVFDYNAKTRNIEVANLEQIQILLDELAIEGDIIRPRVAPGTDQDCDCRWGACPIDYQCKPSATTECNETGSGCGFLLLSSCTHFCVDCVHWDCDNY